MRLFAIVMGLVLSTLGYAQPMQLSGKIVLQAEDNPELTRVLNNHQPIVYHALLLDQPQDIFALDLRYTHSVYLKHSQQSYVQLLDWSPEKFADMALMQPVQVQCQSVLSAHEKAHFLPVLCKLAEIQPAALPIMDLADPGIQNLKP